MNKPDELEQLWKTQPVDPAVKGEEMRQIILKKTEKFDRTIWGRNLRETVAAAVLAVMGSYGAWVQHGTIERASSMLLVAASLWIIYYTWRHGAEPPDPNPDQTLEGYQRALVLKYDHQIRLLRSVKLWYLAPLYAALLTSSVGTFKERAARGAITWLDGLVPLFYTLLFAGIWWLNEVYGVRKLERMRAQVTSGIEENETQC
jgi:hypothetical protein